MTRALLVLFLAVAGTGCTCGNNEIPCNVYFGTKDGKLVPDAMVTENVSNVVDAKAECVADVGLQGQAKAATGSTTLICECGDSP